MMDDGYDDDDDDDDDDGCTVHVLCVLLFFSLGRKEG